MKKKAEEDARNNEALEEYKKKMSRETEAYQAQMDEVRAINERLEKSRKKLQAEVDDAEQDLLLTRCIEESIKTFSTHVECWFYLDSAACEGRGRAAEEDNRGRHQGARTHAQEYPETSPEQLRISEETIKYRLD